MLINNNRKYSLPIKRNFLFFLTFFVKSITANYINILKPIKNVETVTISKEEYSRLKELEKVDWELVESFKRSLEDLKHGKIKRVR